ncbi:MAG: proteic killer suppression protein [Cyclobacteriaceae bacterium]|jgi:proteic killer suppression protein
MIISFKHKGLKKFFIEGDVSKLNPNHINKLSRILFRLNNAKELRDLNVPSWRLHKLKGNLKGCYAIDVSGNFRIVFSFETGDSYDVDYDDYH